MRPCPLLACVLLSVACSSTPASEQPGAGEPSASASASASPAPTATASASATTTAPPSASASSDATAPTPASPPIGPDGKDLAERDLHPALTAASAHVTKKEWGKAKKALQAVLDEKLAASQLHVTIAAHALLGRARAASGDAKLALESYDTVLKLAAQSATIAQLGAEGDAAAAERVRAVTDAASEARYFKAEQRRLQTQKNKAPAYKGSGNNDDVNKFINGEFKKWLTARLKADEELSQLYLAVLDVTPFPSPPWVVRAGQRAASLNDAFASELKTAPMPKEWQGDGDLAGVPKAEIRAIYQRQLGELSEPYVERARAANTKCVQVAATFALKLPEADACAAWLAAHPKAP